MNILRKKNGFLDSEYKKAMREVFILLKGIDSKLDYIIEKDRMDFYSQKGKPDQ